MSINISIPRETELKPRITVIGVGGAGGNAVSNMIRSNLEGVEFLVGNTDAQALSQTLADRRIQLGVQVTQGLGAGARPEVGRAAAEEAIEEIMEHLTGSNMVFITAGMGGGTGTGAAPVIARACRERDILTVGVVTKPFHFEGAHRMRMAEAGIEELTQYVDTLIIIPNQNLFRVANEKTTFADAFKMADDVLYSGVRGVTDLMVMPGLINLDFADIRTVMGEMGKAMMGTGEAEGDKRAIDAAEAAIANPLLEDTSMKGAKGVLINITGGLDMTLFEVDEAANRIREEVDPDANIIFGSTFDESLKGRMRVSVVATGIASETAIQRPPRPELKVVAQRSLMAAAPTLAGIATAALAQPVTVGQVALAQAVLDPPAAAAEEPAVKPMPVSEIAIATPIAPAATAIPTPEVVERAVESPQAAIAVAIKPAPATATIPSAFVPPEPARATAKVEPHKADPFAEADMVNAPKERARPASLFERVTGIGRARPADPTPAKEPGPPKAPTLAVSRPPSTPQPRLNNLDPRDRVAPAYEDDLLDIPTFLRRQAN